MSLNFKRKQRECYLRSGALNGAWLLGRGDAPQVLFNLPCVIDAVKEGRRVYVCAGEKDCIAVNGADPDRLDYCATTEPDGEGHWYESFTKTLTGARHVAIIRDEDEAGRRRATKVHQALVGLVGRLDILAPKAGKDAYDHFQAGCTLEDFIPVPTGEEEAGGSRFQWRRAPFLELVLATPRPIEWLVGGIVAKNEVTAATGAPKVGKSYVFLQIVLDAAAGRQAAGLFEVPRPLRVLWIDEEMGEAKVQRRLQRLVAGTGYGEDTLRLIDQNLDIRPQQGLSLGVKEHLETVRRSIDKSEPELIVMDSLAALQTGEENSATDRRRFYNEILAPLKSEYSVGIILVAHPPLPSKDAHPDSAKRPRGSGDILAQVDRSLWMARVSEAATATSFTVTATLESFVSRDAGDIAPVVVTIDGLVDAPVKVRAEYATSAAGEKTLGQVNACQIEILRHLRSQPERRIYQPELKSHCRNKGFEERHAYYPAMTSLEDLKYIRIDPPEKGSGRSGKWVTLIEKTDE